jgi:hypothetical protein
MPPRRFAPLVKIIRERWYGDEPVGLAGAAQLEGYTHRMLAGTATGLAHYGAAGSPYEGSYTGLVSSPQAFVGGGGVQMGAIKNPPVQDYPALPSGTAPPNLPAAISWDELEGII